MLCRLQMPACCTDWLFSYLRSEQNTSQTAMWSGKSDHILITHLQLASTCIYPNRDKVSGYKSHFMYTGIETGSLSLRPPHLAYSSLMIFSTRLIILPTVVSDGWAAVILLPSFRIISIRSPESSILVEI